jgi:hypothetical protein
LKSSCVDLISIRTAIYLLWCSILSIYLAIIIKRRPPLLLSPLKLSHHLLTNLTAH